MRWRNEVGQYRGFLHAGLIGALIDTACGFAAGTIAGRVLASHYSVNCLAPAVGRSFVACAKVVKAGKKQVFASADLLAEDGADAAHRQLCCPGWENWMFTRPHGLHFLVNVRAAMLDEHA
jgi:uncharacterized protein (TIGR00369 family)